MSHHVSWIYEQRIGKNKKRRRKCYTGKTQLKSYQTVLFWFDFCKLLSIDWICFFFAIIFYFSFYFIWLFGWFSTLVSWLIYTSPYQFKNVTETYEIYKKKTLFIIDTLSYYTAPSILSIRLSYLYIYRKIYSWNIRS